MNSKESKIRMSFLIVQIVAAAVMTVFFVVPRLDSNDILAFALSRAMVIIAFISSIAVFIETKKRRLPISLSMVSMIVGAIVVLLSLVLWILNINDLDYYILRNMVDVYYLFMPSCSIAMVVLAIIELIQKQHPASQQSGMYGNNMQQPTMPMNNGMYIDPTRGPLQPVNNGMYGANMQQPTMPMNNGMYIDPTREPLQPVNNGMYGANMQQPTMPMNNGMYIDPTMTYQNNNQNNNTSN